MWAGLSHANYTNTQVNAGQTLTIQSGGDTNLIGAVARGEQVIADIDGNLSIQSLQDTSTYDSKQQSASGSVTFGAGGGFNANYNQSDIEASYASVEQQSGLHAGDGGFQITTGGDTRLIGAVITSSDDAVTNNLNTLDTASIHTQDLYNHMQFEAEAFSVGTSGAGYASERENESSTTHAGISGIAGNSGVRTGDASSGIANTFDADRLQREVDAQVAITAEFGRQSANAWGTYANQKAAELTLEAWRETDPERRSELLNEADKWSEGGTYHLLGHTVLGGLTGDLSGAVANTASVASMSELGSRIDALDLPDGVKSGLNASLATGIGLATGGTQGATVAYTSELNNRQLHSFEQALANKLAEEGPYTAEEIAQALRGMNNQELGEVPGSNIVVREDNPELADQYDGYAAERFDEGGQWIETGEGVYVQVIPKGLDADIVAYIINGTGGENSPYSLPEFESTGGISYTYLRDPVTGGRLVDENGQYTVTHIIDGQTFSIKHWPCHTSNTGCEGSVPDPASPAYQAWQTAINAKALDDMVTFGMLVGLVPGLGYASTIAMGTTGADLLAHYLRDESIEGASKQMMATGFESYARARGLSIENARQLTNTIGLLGVWDKVHDNGKEMINDSLE